MVAFIKILSVKATKGHTEHMSFGIVHCQYWVSSMAHSSKKLKTCMLTISPQYFVFDAARIDMQPLACS